MQNLQKLIDSEIKEHYCQPVLEGSDVFKNIQKIHDWRNYTNQFKTVWNELTLREKQIIFCMAENQARNEEWD